MDYNSYTAFAYVYDEFMDNVPYDEWTEYVISLLHEYGVTEGLVCELGCGTGQITRRLAAAGYDMIGIDLSEDMLEIAREEQSLCEEETEAEVLTEPSIPPILYLHQDMRSFELYGTVAAIVCLCDSMNYITEEEELLAVFRNVNNYLDRDGVFIFDLNTLAKYQSMGDTTIAENREDASFIWENSFDEDTGRNEYFLTLYLKEESLYRRYEELHVQQAYTLERIKELLVKSGLNFVAAYQVLTREAPNEACERMYIIAREGYQPGKRYV